MNYIFLLFIILFPSVCSAKFDVYVSAFIQQSFVSPYMLQYNEHISQDETFGYGASFGVRYDFIRLGGSLIKEKYVDHDQILVKLHGDESTIVNIGVYSSVNTTFDIGITMLQVRNIELILGAEISRRKYNSSVDNSYDFRYAVDTIHDYSINLEAGELHKVADYQSCNLSDYEDNLSYLNDSFFFFENIKLNCTRSVPETKYITKHYYVADKQIVFGSSVFLMLKYDFNEYASYGIQFGLGMNNEINLHISSDYGLDFSYKYSISSIFFRLHTIFIIPI